MSCSAGKIYSVRMPGRRRSIMLSGRELEAVEAIATDAQVRVGDAARVMKTLDDPKAMLASYLGISAARVGRVLAAVESRRSRRVTKSKPTSSTRGPSFNERVRRAQKRVSDFVRKDRGKGGAR